MPKLGRPEFTKDSVCFCIALTNQSAQSWLVNQDNGQVQIVISSKRIPYSEPDKLAVSVDQSLRELGEDVTSLETTVFCLAPDFVGQDDVVREKKPVLAHLVSELQLNPIGFVSLQEAVVHHITQSSPQFSGVVGTIFAQYVELQLVDQGAIVAANRQVHLDSTAETVHAGLTQLYSAVTSPLTQQAVELAWVENHWSVAEWETAGQQFDYGAVHWPAPTLLEVWTDQESMQVGVEYAGKVWLAATVGTDSLLDASARVFGTGVSMQIADQDGLTHQQPFSDNIPPVEKLRTPSTSQWGKKNSRRRLFLATFVGIGLGLLTLIFLGWGYLKTQSTAILLVTPDSKTISAQVQFTLDQKLSSPDSSNQKLPARVLTTRLSATDSASATGTGFTGEKAKGKVTILNKTESAKPLAAGTQLSGGAGNQVFVLTEAVTLPPASISTQSGGVSEVKTYGTLTTQIEAQAIGEEGNLAKDTALKVGDYAESTYAATVAEALTGGTKHQVAVVTAKDISQLTNKLKQQLQKEALAEFTTRAGQDMEVIPQTTVTVVKTEPSAKEGDQVNEVAIQLTADISGLAYEKATVKAAGLSLLNSQVPAGYSLDESSVQVLSDYVAPTASGSGKVEADLQATARAIVDEEKLGSASQGQTIAELSSALQRANVPVQVIVKWSPAIAGKINSTIPSNPKLIKVTYSSIQ